MGGAACQVRQRLWWKEEVRSAQGFRADRACLHRALVAEKRPESPWPRGTRVSLCSTRTDSRSGAAPMAVRVAPEMGAGSQLPAAVQDQA